MHNDHIISLHVFNSMVKPNSFEVKSENVIEGCDIDHVPYHQEEGTHQGGIKFQTCKIACHLAVDQVRLPTSFWRWAGPLGKGLGSDQSIVIHLIEEMILSIIHCSSALGL